MTNPSAEPLLVDFVGELYHVEPGTRFSIGREGDLVLDDDNLFLHRNFLILEHDTGLWWVANVGSHMIKKHPPPMRNTVHVPAAANRIWRRFFPCVMTPHETRIRKTATHRHIRATRAPGETSCQPAISLLPFSPQSSECFLFPRFSATL